MIPGIDQNMASAIIPAARRDRMAWTAPRMTQPFAPARRPRDLIKHRIKRAGRGAVDDLLRCPQFDVRGAGGCGSRTIQAPFISPCSSAMAQGCSGAEHTLGVAIPRFAFWLTPVRNGMLRVGKNQNQILASFMTQKYRTGVAFQPPAFIG